MQLNNLKTTVVLLAVFCSVSAAKIIYVDDDATGANDGTSWENAYIYLQDALEDANSAEKPVKWEISEGGNGHIYQVVAMPEGVSWSDAKEAAEAAGGYLATITSGEENEFVFKLIDDDVYWHHFASGNNHGPWIGGFQQDGAAEPDGGWSWITGEAFSYSNWLRGEPTGYWGAQNENRLQYSSMTGTRESTWNDLIDVLPDFYAVYAYVIEYEEYISEPVEIRVAQGTYKPDHKTIQNPRERITNPTIGDREVSFRLINGVSIKGGYAGIGSQDPNARDIELYETILSGDLNGDDLPVSNPTDMANEPTRSENSYHVVWGGDTDNTAVIEGFTITAGNADGDWRKGYFGGGGFCNWYGSPVVKDCLFTRNSGGNGGGMRNAYAGTTILNCTYIENITIEEWGGGIVNIGCDNITIAGCLFVGNVSDTEGGGIYSRNSTVTVSNSTLYGNIARNAGGGVYNDSVNDFTMMNSILWANVDANGSTETSQVNSGIINHTCVQGWTGTYRGEGNINADPLFADPNNGDYHLKSEYGRWNPNTQTWVVDDVTSPCIDAGDPNTPVGDEPQPNGGRINMGAYGGTSEASMSLTNVTTVYIQWIGHASVKIWTEDAVVYVDPRIFTDAPHDADLILVTHSHSDHYSPIYITRASNDNTLFLAPPDVIQMYGSGQAIAPGETIESGDVVVTGVPAYNINKTNHPKSRNWLGYIIEIGGRRIYVAGDTDLIEEMKTLGEIDAAFLPVSGTYAMNATEAAAATTYIQPGLAIPYHWGEFIGTINDAQTFAQQAACPVRIMSRGEIISLDD